MEVTFRTRKLEKDYREFTKGVKAYGPEVARKYIQRINIVKQVRDIDELMNLPALGCHPLKGNRLGQYAVKLTGFYRLIFTLRGDALEIAHIEEVSKHYGD
ncbi:type II toxin-antitoxin system RelE/ParE family toxin [Thermodesulfobacteriota bacterium]